MTVNLTAVRERNNHARASITDFGDGEPMPFYLRDHFDDVHALLAEVERLREALERRARNEARLANVLDEVREYAQHQDDAGDAPWVGTDLHGILDKAATS
jgi:hypothetical protein